MTGLLQSPTVRRLLAVLPLVLALLQAPAAVAGAGEARATAERLVAHAHSAMIDPALSEPERNARLRQAIAETFAFDVWERFILLGKEGLLTEAQRAEFRSLLPGYVAGLYRDRFAEGLEAKPRIEDVRQVREDYLVRARIPRPETGPLPVDWRIRDFGARGHLVADVMVGGVSFLLMKRDELTGVLEQQGPQRLLEVMRSRSI